MKIKKQKPLTDDEKIFLRKKLTERRKARGGEVEEEEEEEEEVEAVERKPKKGGRVAISEDTAQALLESQRDLNRKVDELLGEETEEPEDEDDKKGDFLSFLD